MICGLANCRKLFSFINDFSFSYKSRASCSTRLAMFITSVTVIEQFVSAGLPTGLLTLTSFLLIFSCGTSKRANDSVSLKRKKSA